MRCGTVILVLVGLCPAGVHGQVRSEGGYAVSQGTTEIAYETYTIENRVLSSVLHLPSRGLVISGSTTYDGRWSPVRYEADARPDANHTFKHATVRGAAAQAAQYTDPTLPIVQEPVDAVVQWIEGLP